MAKLTREGVVQEALALLDQVGLDAVSTRALARRLGVEQPSLYWHFRSKDALLAAMAAAAMASHTLAPLPRAGDDWREWFIENSRSFRRALLAHRDGARLHAGSVPQTEDLPRIMQKMHFMVAAGLPERDVQVAMLAAGQFTVGSVLEQQTTEDRRAGSESDDEDSDGEHPDPDEAFEAGLGLIADGLALRQTRRTRRAMTAP
jgi:TetR/AcrR family transcriptional regulator, tetracycline repressor protein